VQHHAAMDGKPLAAPAADSLSRRGLTTPSADAAAARVPPPLRGGRRTATAWRRATHSAGAAAAADAASSTGATLRGVTCGGRESSGADTGGKLTADHLCEVARAEAVRCACALFNVMWSDFLSFAGIVIAGGWRVPLDVVIQS